MKRDETNVAEIAVMAGGTLTDESSGSLMAQGVSKDTRTLAPGNLYIPLIGEAFDGHRFVEAASRQGAVGSFWQQDRPDAPEGVPLILVDDTLAALQRLAVNYKRQLHVRIVGITGSNGKTTTKDMTAAVLQTSFRVHKTGGNYNNHIGLPLTLLQLSEDTEIAVLEMGMSGRGEIEFLSRLAEPEIAVITNIGEAHLLQLGTRQEIARAKTEILAGLLPGGTLVYNGDEPLIEEVLPELSEPGRMQAPSYGRVRFGHGAENDLYPSDIRMDAKGTHYRIHEAGARDFYIPLLGAHNVVNSLAAYAVGRHFGLDAETIARGLAGAAVTGMRIEVMHAPSGLTIFNDATTRVRQRCALRLRCCMKRKASSANSPYWATCWSWARTKRRFTGRLARCSILRRWRLYSCTVRSRFISRKGREPDSRTTASGILRIKNNWRTSSAERLAQTTSC